MEGMMAAAHPFRQTTGNGIKLDRLKGTVSLWEQHKLLKEVALEPVGLRSEASSNPVSASARYYPTVWDYWHSLQFVEDFPQVSHWWFGSFWTGRVRLSTTILPLFNQDQEAEMLVGFMQFIDEQTESVSYSITADTNPIEIAVQLPELYADYANVPLRLALAELVIAVAVEGNIKSDEWQIVTSLIERDKLADRFPLDPNSTNWCLEHTSGSLRTVLCTALGLKQDEETAQPVMLSALSTPNSYGTA